MEAAERRQRRSDDLLPRRLARRVVHPEQRPAALPAEALRQGLALRRIDVGQHHRGAFAHEQFRLGSPLPARRPGDQGNLVRQFRHRLLSPQPKDCHCEERSDKAISLQLSTTGTRLLRCARNDIMGLQLLV